MPRTILIHLNVTVPDGHDDVGPDEIADCILGAIEAASDDEYNLGGRILRKVLGPSLDLASDNGGPISVALAEEV